MCVRLVALVALAATTALATPSAGRGAFRDVLDTPAVGSELSARSLINGLTRAGARLVAVGQRGHVLVSDDEGRSWSQSQVPLSADLVAVSFPDAAHGWAVGHDGVVLHTVDAGRTWQTQLDGRRTGTLVLEHDTRQAATLLASDPKRAEALLADAKRFATHSIENPWLDVWFSDASNGFVVGAFGMILRTTDGGRTWEPWLHAADNPKGLHLYAVRGIGQDVFIVGEQGLVLKLDRDAGRFRALELPYNGTLFGITGNERAVVVHGLRGSVLRSADGGRSWQAVSTGLPVGITASARTDDGRLVLVSQAGHVLVSRDDGATFAAAPVQRGTPAAAVVAAASNAIVVGGPRGLQSVSLP
jgi:photosystem II stability/assembly factor-like uncharacterized protein